MTPLNITAQQRAEWIEACVAHSPIVRDPSWLDELILKQEHLIPVHTSAEFFEVLKRGEAKQIFIRGVRRSNKNEHALWIFLVDYPQLEEGKFFDL